jgi:hypothetical protein
MKIVLNQRGHGLHFHFDYWKKLAAQCGTDVHNYRSIYDVIDGQPCTSTIFYDSMNNNRSHPLLVALVEQYQIPGYSVIEIPDDTDLVIEEVWNNDDYTAEQQGERAYDRRYMWNAE